MVTSKPTTIFAEMAMFGTEYKEEKGTNDSDMSNPNWVGKDEATNKFNIELKMKR